MHRLGAIVVLLLLAGLTVAQTTDSQSQGGASNAASQAQGAASDAAAGAKGAVSGAAGAVKQGAQTGYEKGKEGVGSALAGC